MTNFITGFATAFGGTLGVLCALFAVWFIIRTILLIIKKRRTMRKMPKLILKYRTVLISLEKFEELMLIDRFLERLKRNEMPRELSLRYSAKYLKNFIRQYEEA